MYLTHEWIKDKQCYRIIDTDFDYVDTAYQRSLWDTIVRVYEERNLNVATNIVRAVRAHHHNWSAPLSFTGLMKYILEHEKSLAKYKDGIEKYMTLV